MSLPLAASTDAASSSARRGSNSGTPALLLYTPMTPSPHVSRRSTTAPSKLSMPAAFREGSMSRLGLIVGVVTLIVATTAYAGTIIGNG